jgi:hypothetical protein
VGMYASWFNHPTWGGARFIPPLFEGEEALEVVYLAPVEKVRMLRDDRACHVCKGRSPLDPKLERFGFQRLGTFLRDVCGYILSGGTRWSGPKPVT